MNKLGERIYKYRTARGLSQLELSELLEVSRQSISKWETDVAVPELSKLVKMAEIFEISLDSLVLGKEDAAEDAKKEEKIIAAPAPEQAQKIEKMRESSRLKTGFGWFFLGMGTLLFFLMFLFADILSALFLFIPFGLCAFFCLRQFRRAALWCTESWYVCIMAYFHSATGTYWIPDWMAILRPTGYENTISTVMSFVFFFMLVFFICLTVFSFRKEKFELSKKKRIFWAACALLSLPLKSLFSTLYIIFLYKIKPTYLTDTKYAFHLLIPGSLFLFDFAMTALFTASLIPTVYWIRSTIAEKKKSKKEQ